MAQLAIPPAPRKVVLAQVPGALKRVALVGGVALGLTLVAWVVGLQARGWVSDEREFLARAVEVPGTVADVQLPRLEEREGGTARLRVLFTLEGREHSAANVPMDALAAEGLGAGAKVTLLVDPGAPQRVREKAWATSRGGVVWLANLLLGLGVLVTLALVTRELRRAVRQQVAPLRTGAIVWLTPKGPLPDARGGEVVFPASYYRDDVLFEVTARGAAGSWVKNGEKVLAALVPGEATWVRVIDEALARRLGWFR